MEQNSVSDTETQYDLAIIGGGFAGVGVAQAAAKSQQRTILFEKDTLLSQTSANSLRIVHGGFRYLQQCNLKRLTHSVQAQDYLLKKYPKFITRLPCVMPLKKIGFKSRYPVLCAAYLYQILTKLITGRKNNCTIKSSEWVQENIQLLSYAAPNGVLYWEDAIIQNFMGFCDHLKEELYALQVSLKENSKVVSVQKISNGFKIETEQESFFAKKVVHTTGPWLQQEIVESDKSHYPDLEWSKGYNVILNKKILEGFALGIESSKGRLFFITPRGDQTVVGTWYKPFSQDIEKLSLAEEEIEEILSDLNSALPALELKRTDIEATEIGLLPMKKVHKDEPALYGKERIFVKDNQFFVMSTKFTTFISMGKKVLKVIGQNF